MSMRGREEAGLAHDHVGGAGTVQGQRRHPGRGDEPHHLPGQPPLSRDIGTGPTENGTVPPGTGPDILPAMFAWSEVCGERPAVMGIVNVTPDSFSDGGRFLDPDAAVAHGLALVGGGRRPPRRRRRVDPSRRRAGRRGRRAAPGAAGRRAPRRRRRRAGQHRHQQGGGGRGRARRRRDDRQRRRRRAPTPRCSQWSRPAGAGFVVMHMQGEPRTMQHDPHYDDVVVEVGDFLRRAARRRACRGHRAPRALCADPGHRVRQDRRAQPRAARRGSRELVDRVDVPVLVGPSRKTFIGACWRRSASRDLRRRRDDGTLATAVWAVDHGARIVRVHDVGAGGRRRCGCSR